MEAAGQLADPGGQAVWRPEAGGVGQHLGVGGQGAQEIELSLVHQPGQVDAGQGARSTPRSAAIRPMAAMRAWAYCT